MTEPNASPAKEVWITGIGIATSLGEGLDAHWDALNARRINVDEKTFAPYIVHPLAPVNFDAQIPKKGDQRQMEAWQRIGTYAAGLALDSAGVKGNKEILGADGHDRRRRRRRARSRRRHRHPERRRQGQLGSRLSQRTADERSAADAVPGPALQSARRQYRHRPRRFRNVAHLHGRGSRQRRRGADRAGADRRRPKRHRAGRRGPQWRAPRSAAALRIRRLSI